MLYFDGDNFKKLYTNSYAEELISLISTDSDAMQIALSYVNQEPLYEKRYSHIRAEQIFTQNRQVATIVRSINSILGLLLDAELSKTEKPSPDDRRGYEEAIALQRKIYQDFGVAFQNAKVLTNIYAELPCTLEEKSKRILEIDKQLLDHSYSQTYYINKKKQTEDNLGLTKCYVFDSAENYLNFLLLNLIQLNPNICLCQNCGELFVAKTKKKLSTVTGCSLTAKRNAVRLVPRTALNCNQRCLVLRIMTKQSSEIISAPNGQKKSMSKIFSLDEMIIIIGSKEYSELKSNG